MKKFLSALLLLFLLPLSACATTLAEKQDEATDEGWVEVQSITYQVGNDTTTLTSTYMVELSDVKQSSRREFDAAPDNQKLPFDAYWVSDEINVNKSNIVENPSQIVGKEYFIRLQNPVQYIIAKVEEYNIRYVKYRILSDGFIEICHYESGENITRKILPASYEIIEFSN